MAPSNGPDGQAISGIAALKAISKDVTSVALSQVRTVCERDLERVLLAPHRSHPFLNASPERGDEARERLRVRRAHAAADTTVASPAARDDDAG
jgi:hypothetical protein